MAGSCGEARVKFRLFDQVIPSQAEGSVNSTSEGLETTSLSSTRNNNSHERPAPYLHAEGEDIVRSSKETLSENINNSQLSFNWGNLALTNLQVAGQLASDQTYVILALRVWLYFDGTDARALYQQTASQLYFTLTLGDKPQFVAPCWYHPAGGGIYGLDATTAIFNHGYPSQQAILKLARPIITPVRQNFNVNAEFFSVGTTNVLDILNQPADNDQMVIMYMLDGQKPQISELAN